MIKSKAFSGLSLYTVFQIWLPVMAALFFAYRVEN